MTIFAAIVVVFLVINKPSPPAVPQPIPKQESSSITTIASNLDIPWDMAFLPEGEILITERPGRVRLVGKDGTVKPTAILEIKEVKHQGEGGLLGIALHPQFTQNKLVYLYYTYRNGFTTLNKVVRYKFGDNKLVFDKTIIDNIPGGIYHDGGRIKFGPDGKLYVTTGDATIDTLAQDTGSWAGKILRINDDGSLPNDNPFANSPIYSYGHRNPQGLSWDTSGRLWETEHGPQGFDEVNLIESGKNYGWPEIKGNTKKDGLVTPFISSLQSTWAPSGATIKDNFLYFSGLRSNEIFKLDLGNGEIKTYFANQFGRIRTINIGPDGNFYILTNNTDGRGTPKDGDDRLIKIDPAKLDNGGN